MIGIRFSRTLFPFLLTAGLFIAGTGCDTSNLLCPPGSACQPSGGTTGSTTASGADFSDAIPVEFDAQGNASFNGTIDSGSALVYDLGAFQPGDRIRLTVEPSAGSALDPTAAIFNAVGELLALNDDVNLDAGLIGSALDEIVSVAGDHYYLAIAKYYGDHNGGGFAANVRVEGGGTFSRPAVQYLLLEFGGGTVTIPAEGTINVNPFDAADIDPAYAGKTAEIKAGIVATVAQNYQNTGLIIVTSDDPPPPAGAFSTLYFGAYSATKFGVAEGVDEGNRNRCDDGIVYTDDFDKPFAKQPSVDGIGVAIGNVASHEAGHLLGLNHVANVLDLMDNTGTASTLLADQEFITSPLSPSIFPIGYQNGAAMLERVIPK